MWEGNVFTPVCPFTGRGVPQSLVLGPLWLRGYPSHWYQVPSHTGRGVLCGVGGGRLSCYLFILF